MEHKIDLKLTIKNLELSEYEKNQKIHISVRSSGNKKVGSEHFYEMDWEYIGELSKPKLVTIDLPKKNQPDLRLFVQINTCIENSVGLPAPVCYGTAQTDLKDLVDMVKEIGIKKTFPIEVDIECVMGSTLTTPKIVGKLVIEILNPQELAALKFEPVAAHHIIQSNSSGISKALNRYIQSELRFIEARAPLVPEIDNILHPCQKSDVYIPGKYFFTDITEGRSIEDEEKFFGNLLQISLNRNNTDVQWFNEKAESLFNGTINDYDKMKVVKTFADVCTILPTSRYYASDRMYIGGELKETEDFQTVERFDEICGSNSSGDCEDDAKSIYNHVTRLQRTSFISQPLKNLSKISQMYVACGTLASVQGAQLGDAKRETEIFIGDANDQKVQKGAHMFVTVIPHTKFVNMVYNGPKKSDANLLKSQYYDKKFDSVSNALPSMALEGTGSMNPFIFPPQCYTTDQKIGCDMKMMHIKHKKVQSQVMTSKNTLFISQGMMQQIPSSEEDKPDKQPKFLRYATQLYTDKFGKVDTFFPSDGKNRGLSIRSMFLSDNKTTDIKNEKHYKEPTLEMLPRESLEDEKIFLNLKSQLPIYPRQTISDNYVKFIGASVSPSGEKRIDRLFDFNNKCNEFVRGRIANDFVDLTISYKHDILFDAGLRNTRLIDGILNEVKNSQNIIGAQAKMVVLTDKMHVVDIKYRFQC